MDGWITDIQHFSLHDGPGIRTTVFLKGCQLRCAWCHNPESIAPGPEIQCIGEHCIRCGRCVAVCSREAVRLSDGGAVVDRERCGRCGRCAEACAAGALVKVGDCRSVDDILAQVMKDRVFYDRSGGGVTISGGEPFYQVPFTLELLRAAKRAGLHTAVDTNLLFPWEQINAVRALADLFLIDFKMWDRTQHERWTGCGNECLTENMMRLNAAGAAFSVRIPVIEGANDQPHAIGEIGRFLSGLDRLADVELLPYHALGVAKAKALGSEVGCEMLAAPAEETRLGLEGILQNLGLPLRSCLRR